MWVGLSGQAGAGKDTAATRFPEIYRRYAFATPLKQALAVLGLEEPADRAQKEGLIPGRGYSWRTAAQTLGTDWARNLDQDFWTNLASDKCSTFANVLFTDVRFENEAAMIRSRQGLVVHIRGRTSITDSSSAAHKSEKPLQVQDNDVVIYNNKDLQSFYSAIDDLVMRLGATQTEVSDAR